MTIGMLIESLTGKAGALSGQFVDASPFQASDKGAPVDHPAEFGKILEEAGFARNGGEVRCGRPRSMPGETCQRCRPDGLLVAICA
jgi:DNA-directed RNA polymerase beta subunit